MEDFTWSANDVCSIVPSVIPKTLHELHQVTQLVSYSYQDRFELAGPIHLCIKFLMDLVDLLFDDRYLNTVGLHVGRQRP
jgi:hypothetical protein